MKVDSKDSAQGAFGRAKPGLANSCLAEKKSRSALAPHLREIDALLPAAQLRESPMPQLR